MNWAESDGFYGRQPGPHYLRQLARQWSRRSFRQVVVCIFKVSMLPVIKTNKMGHSFIFPVNLVLQLIPIVCISWVLT